MHLCDISQPHYTSCQQHTHNPMDIFEYSDGVFAISYRSQHHVATINVSACIYTITHHHCRGTDAWYLLNLHRSEMPEQDTPAGWGGTSNALPSWEHTPCGCGKCILLKYPVGHHLPAPSSPRSFWAVLSSDISQSWQRDCIVLALQWNQKLIAQLGSVSSSLLVSLPMVWWSAIHGQSKDKIFKFLLIWLRDLQPLKQWQLTYWYLHCLSGKGIPSSMLEDNCVPCTCFKVYTRLSA